MVVSCSELCSIKSKYTKQRIRWLILFTCAKLDMHAYMCRQTDRARPMHVAANVAVCTVAPWRAPPPSLSVERIGP